MRKAPPEVCASAGQLSDRLAQNRPIKDTYRILSLPEFAFTFPVRVRRRVARWAIETSCSFVSQIPEYQTGDVQSAVPLETHARIYWVVQTTKWAGARSNPQS